ncbi:methyltransferase domain-containing protein [Betaproteobacteria bacterium LSUCC0115]|nr:methyltransferase domain-containing protein [Burkholderiales bacterium LSUCC0115]
MDVKGLQAFWDERYAGTEFAFGEAPNDCLVEQLAAHPPLAGAGGSSLPMTALALADGEGRNGVWLAEQGYAVTSIDVSPKGLDKATRLAEDRKVSIQTVLADLTAYDFGQQVWSVVASIFLHLPADKRREVNQRVVAALQPGGTFVFEGYGKDQLKYGTGGPKDSALLYELSALRADFDGLPVQLVHEFSGERLVQEGVRHTGLASVVQVTVRRYAE